MPKRRPRPSSAHLTARAKSKRTAAERADLLKADALRGRRIGMLYGLTGLFTLVVGGLVVARPRPLVASLTAVDGPNVVLTALHAPTGPDVTGAFVADPIEAALQTGSSAKPGAWTGVTVLRLTTTQARSTQAHFKVVLEGDRTPQVVVGTDWLRQTRVPSDRPSAFAARSAGQFVLVVVVDDHEREVKGEATVVALVDRLCAKLKIDPSRVLWS